MLKKILVCLGAVSACALACGTDGGSKDPIIIQIPGNIPISDDGGSKDINDASIDVSMPVDANAPCISENDATFCARHSAVCGSLIGLDNCGAERTVSICGNCPASQFCNSGVCTSLPCIPETDAALCANAGKSCGTISASDNCGVIRNPNCGSCISPQVCNAGTCQTPCVPESDFMLCSSKGWNCGSNTGNDNCGTKRTVSSCGSLQFGGGAGSYIADGVPYQLTGSFKYIEGWINPTFNNGGIVRLGQGAGAIRFWFDITNGSLSINGGAYGPGLTTISVPLNKWTFVFAGIEAGSPYVGKIVNNIVYKQIVKIDVAFGNIIAGDLAVIGSSFYGKMNNVSLWSSIPNNADYHNCIPSQPGLVRQWCMREGSGSFTTDSVFGTSSLLNSSSWATGSCADL